MISTHEKLQMRLLADCANWPSIDKSLLDDIEDSTPTLSDIELLALLNIVKQMALNGEGHIAMINWYSGMMLEAFMDRLQPYQEQFIPDFLEAALKHFNSESSRLGTLYFGLSHYNLAQHIDVVATVVMNKSFEQAFSIIDAFSTMDYRQVAKLELMHYLYLFRRYRREDGKHYKDLIYEFDSTIRILRNAVVKRRLLTKRLK